MKCNCFPTRRGKKFSYLKNSLELFVIFYTDLTEKKIQKRGRAIPVDYYNLIHSTLPNFFIMSPTLLRKAVCP